MTTELSDSIDRRAHRHRVEAFLASRDAGRELTLDSLRAGITLRAVVAAAADLAAYADEAVTIVQEEYRPALHCREGCSYCCCKPGVLTSIPELLRIVAHVRATFSPTAIRGLAARARVYVGQLRGRSFNEPTAESVPCPLLQDGRCAVYALRPLVCRGYNSTDVTACRKAYHDPDELVPIFAVLKDVTDGATIGSAQALETRGFNATVVDLGTALDIALTADEGFAAAVAAGGTALRPAEDPSWVGDLWNRVRETARQLGIEEHRP